MQTTEWLKTRKWIRICQECGYEQMCKPTPEYKGESWKDLKCKKCHSESLSYGCWVPGLRDDEKEDLVDGSKT